MTLGLSYKEMLTYDTFEDRLKYLSLAGRVGEETFASHRYLNQRFYRSREWKNLRNHIVARDLGRDLGVEGYEIAYGPSIMVHHINPLTLDDIREGSDKLFDPDNLITVTQLTHNQIHYGTGNSRLPMVERKPGDTKLW